MRISDEMRSAIVHASITDKKSPSQIAEAFSISENTVATVLKRYAENGISDKEASQKHAAIMAQKRAAHEQQTVWMTHITPLHEQKRALEAEIARRQEALDEARQEYRNFLATVRQLMDGDV